MAIDRIHDRVPKTQEGDHWEISKTKETKEEKKRDEDKQRRQREQDVFGESSDFIQLLSKDPRKYKREKIDSAQIDKFTFRGVSTHREKAILEVDISLRDGTLIKGAQVAVSRQEGMKYISRKIGEDIVVDQLVQGGSYLTVALPQRRAPTASRQPDRAQAGPLITDAARMEWYYYLLFGILFVAVLALIYVFLMV